MQIIDDMKATREETLSRFALGDADLDRTYGPGKWSVRYVLHHIADAETVLFERIRRVLSEGHRVLWAFDQEAWAQSLDYQVRPMALSRDLYLASREGAMFYASQSYDAKGHLEWIHSETGVRTLKDEFDKVVWHNAKHLEQIARALGQTPGSATAS
ncbi:MAG: metal-dependent hydrolase [Acidobacteria bacterium]|nr:metal-dependent hydrolase [Acidobacteriota bacterium]